MVLEILLLNNVNACLTLCVLHCSRHLAFIRSLKCYLITLGDGYYYHSILQKRKLRRR